MDKSEDHWLICQVS